MGDHQDDDDRQQSNGQYLTDHPPDDGNRSVKSSARPRRFDYATHISDIRQATTIKHNQVFLLTDDAGDILPQYLGYGMYFRDMCYLDHLELRLQGKRCVSLLADASAGSQAVYELTNPSLELSNGHTLSKERLSVRRVIALREYLTQTITIRNLDQAPVELAVELRYGSHFTDIFTIRGAKQGKRGTLHVPKSHHDEVVLGYSGADGHKRTTTLRFSPTPADVSGKQAQYHLRLKPGEAATLTMTYELQDDGQQADAPSVGTCTEKTGTGKHASFCRVLAQTPQVDTGNVLFNRALARSLTDLQMLATANVDDLYVAAGIPWYVALFGRDSCITAFETLAYHMPTAQCSPVW